MLLGEVGMQEIVYPPLFYYAVITINNKYNSK